MYDRTYMYPKEAAIQLCYLQVPELKDDILLQLLQLWIHRSCNYYAVKTPE